jgi:hypothetical protein
MHSANTTNVTLADDCIDFQFARSDFLRLRDIFIYSFQGIDVGEKDVKV